MTSSSRGRLRALTSAMRPAQWVKNGLIVIAPAAAHQLGHSGVLANTAVAFVVFCALSSAVYLFNDVADAESDRAHPVKKRRAIAAGHLSPQLAVTSGAVLVLVAFALAMVIRHPTGLMVVMAIYLAISLAYTAGLKRLPIIEMAAVASGFFLRSLAGAAASHLFVSTWFLVVISFGALFLVVGKRSSELKLRAASSRSVLTQYTTEFLHSALTLCATVTVSGYCLWAFDSSKMGLSSIHHHVLPIRLSVIPVVLVVLFIMRSIDGGEGEAPDALLYHDRVVQVTAVLWALLLLAGVY